MPKPATPKKRLDHDVANPFEKVTAAVAARAAEPHVHKIMRGVVCKTDTRGLAMPSNRSPAEIVVDASRGFIPLWAKDVTLRWRFQEQSMAVFQNPDAAKEAVKELLGDAILLWGDAAPVKFAQRTDVWDFEIVMQSSDDCDANGCVLASAFFPDAGRHELFIYPKMFTQSREERVETMAHEIGHVFGLRHFFAQISEARWRSEVFGTHSPFSIMNYGDESKMTDNDRSDLSRLYSMVWSGQLQAINGTPIKIVQLFSAASSNPFVMSLAAATAQRATCCCCYRNQLR
jgi:Metallo-peptidase family M12B Reprolysin-like